MSIPITITTSSTGVFCLYRDWHLVFSTPTGASHVTPSAVLVQRGSQMFCSAAIIELTMLIETSQHWAIDSDLPEIKEGVEISSCPD